MTQRILSAERLQAARDFIATADRTDRVDVTNAVGLIAPLVAEVDRLRALIRDAWLIVGAGDESFRADFRRKLLWASQDQPNCMDDPRKDVTIVRGPLTK